MASPTPNPPPPATGRLAAGQGFPTDPFPTDVVAADINGDGRPDLISGGQNGVSVLLDQVPATGSVPSLAFGPPTTIATPHATVSLAVGHLRASSTRPDIVSASAAGTQTLSIIPNNSAGAVLQLGSPVNIDTGGANFVTVADLDGDGLDEIIVADANDSNVTVLHNDGNLAFTPSAFSVGATPTSVTTADFNRDGKRDIAVTTAANVVVLLNQTVNALAFAPAAGFPLPVTGRWIAAADFDGDGIPDIAAATASDNVSVFLGTTAQNAPVATFAAVKNLPVTDARSVAVADMNGDGKIDLVVGDGGPADARTGGMSVLLNTSSIGVLGFAAAAHGTGGFQTAGVAVADFNGDGRPDIATASTQIGTLVTFVNLTVSGSLALETAPQFAAGAAPYGIALGDLNGDGKLDVVVSNNSANTVTVLLNTSSGLLPSFAAPSTVPSGGTGPRGICLADVDGDGKLDIAVANATSNSVAVLRNTGTGTFAAAVTASVGAGPLAVAVADIDGDGRPDIVAANGGAASVSVVRGASSTGTVAFGATSTFGVDSPPTALVVTDLDGDGKSDVAVTVDVGRVDVLVNGSSSGTVAFAAPFSIAVQGGPTGLALGDIDRDGQPDLVESAHGGVTILRNTSTAGAPSFVPTNIGTASSQANSIALVDVDNDGRPDIVLGGTFNDTLVLRNTTPGPGTPSFTEPALFESGNVSQAFIAVGDINGDRRPDVVSPNLLENTIAVLLGY